jgi:hypothetical protein
MNLHVNRVPKVQPAPEVAGECCGLEGIVRVF